MENPQTDGWKITESGFDPGRQLWAESVFSLGNGLMGHRGSFEEQYSGESRPASYLSGLFVQEPLDPRELLPGYPTHRTVLAEAPSWIDLELEFDGEALDLGRCEILHFERILCLKEAVLERNFTVRMPSGRRLSVRARRFCSAVDRELGVLQYTIQPLDFSGTLALVTGVDANTNRETEGVSAAHWAEVESRHTRTQAYLLAEIKQADFQICTGMKLDIRSNDAPVAYHSFRIQRNRYAGLSVDMPCKKGDRIEITKYVAFMASHQDKDPAALFARCRRLLRQAAQKGFPALLQAHALSWAARWGQADVQIEGDIKAQKALRFNIFHLLQAYSGHDERLNIGQRGLTGEKTGGAAYWLSDIFLPPFYAAAGNPQAARNLLLNRYRQLPKAKMAALRMGFGQGAALFPFATLDGDETMGQWESTFEAIHRNGALAWAIRQYVDQTGDHEFLYSYGLEMLTAIARFWALRTFWNEAAMRYELQGVTGPGGYEINVNNNWYTNYIATWSLRYAAAVADDARNGRFQGENNPVGLPDPEETAQWLEISRAMWLPQDTESGLFLQQAGFLCKPPGARALLDPGELPLWKHWTWDRILRSPFSRHPDLLLGFYLFGEAFSREQLERHFDFYEPLTLFESGSSFAVHALLASRLSRRQQAYELTLNALHLDLGDLLGDTGAGCDIPAMGAAWRAVIYGIVGLSFRENGFSLRPVLPFDWKSLRFALSYRNCRLQIHVTKTQCHLVNLSGQELEVQVFKKDCLLPPWGEAIAVYVDPTGTTD